MVKAVRVHTIGGRHHLQLEDVELPHPGCNEVEVRHTAIGLNSPDIDACKGGGHHPAHSTFTPGLSAVGVITELGIFLTSLFNPIPGFCQLEGHQLIACICFLAKELGESHTSLFNPIPWSCSNIRTSFDVFVLLPKN